MWTQLKLKFDETSFFCSQLEAHIREPKLFFFYLSAFLSSARSVTYHIQKQFRSSNNEIYERLRSEMLSDQLCSYFLKLRNYSLHQNYPPLSFVSYSVHGINTHGETVLIAHSSCSLFTSMDDKEFRWLEDIVRNEWDFTSINRIPKKLVFHFNFLDTDLLKFPGSDKSVVSACKLYTDRLWYFLASFRSEWEKKNDPQAPSAKFNKWIDVWGR